MIGLRNPSIRRNQQGAVLFISLILLVILSLIGIASMQVTTLQERMAGNYYAQNRAFEYAEWMARTQENAIETSYLSGATYISSAEFCDETFPVAGTPTYSADAWAAKKTPTGVGGTVSTTAGYNMVAGSWYVRRIDKCIAGQGSLVSNRGPVGNNTTAIYQILGADNDAPTISGAVDNTAASSVSVVATVYVPN
jgi:type IV pilus assembly protein PilX